MWGFRQAAGPGKRVRPPPPSLLAAGTEDGTAGDRGAKRCAEAHGPMRRGVLSHR